VRATAESSRDGASLVEIETFVDSFLANGDVVALAEAGALLRREDVIRRRDGRLVSAVAASPKYSTPELLAIEQRVIDQVIRSGGADAGVAQLDAVARALRARPTMGQDQEAMVRGLCLGGAGVQVVLGPPGTGKTFALAAAREAWERSGLKVLGAAVARRAAVELTSASGIDATSVAALISELRHGDPHLLDERTIVVIDEAGMIGTVRSPRSWRARARREQSSCS
jgi:hypothetical protein